MFFMHYKKKNMKNVLDSKKVILVLSRPTPWTACSIHAHILIYMENKIPCENSISRVPPSNKDPKRNVHSLLEN